MEIKEGCFYRTRRGQKAEVLKSIKASEGTKGFVGIIIDGEFSRACTWQEDGRHHCLTTHVDDLFAPWKDKIKIECEAFFHEDRDDFGNKYAVLKIAKDKSLTGKRFKCVLSEI